VGIPAIPKEPKFFREVGIEIALEVAARAQGSRSIAAKFLGPFGHIIKTEIPKKSLAIRL
jgi:hypothetical protein